MALKKIVFACYFIIIDVIISSETIIDFSSDFVSSVFFDRRIELSELTPRKGGYSPPFIDNTVPYNKYHTFDFDKMNLHLIYRPYERNVPYDILEINGKIYSLGEYQYEIDYEKEYRSIIQEHSFFWAFSYNDEQYICAICPRLGWYVYAPRVILIFRIRENSCVDFLTADSFTFDKAPEIGFYAGKLCFIKTNLYEKYMRRARLYSLEEDGLVEVLDKDGHGIELTYQWDSATYNEVTIISKHIPANPVLLNRENSSDIKPDIIPFETELGNSFPPLQSSDTEEIQIESEASGKSEAKDQETAEEKKPVVGKYVLVSIAGICFLIIVGVTAVVIIKGKCC